MAWVLRNRLGLQVGDRVAIFSGNHTWFPITVYACELSGLVATLVNPGSTAKELASFVSMTDSKVLLAHPAVLGKAAEAARSIPDLQLLSLDETDEMRESSAPGVIDVRSLLGDEEQETFTVDNAAERTVFICFSSGTSGFPKAVEITHANVIASLAQMLVTHEGSFTSSDVQIGVLPFCHIYGLVKIIHHPFMIGMPVVILPRFDMVTFCRQVEAHRATISLLVPPIILLMSNSPIVDQHDLSSLKVIQSGGAPLSPDLARQVESKWPNLRIVQGYGLTESCPSVICTGPVWLPSSRESVGRIAPGVEVRLIDDEGNDVPRSKDGDKSCAPGELWLRGPSIMKGYLHNPTANADAFPEAGTRWFNTGDVAYYSAGELFVIDRKKELIKYKGFQVPPAELEAMLLTHPKLCDALVLGVVDESQATELPRAYVVPRNSAVLQDETQKMRLAAEVASWVAANVANHKKLRGGVFLVASIPKSPSGKLLRRVMRQQVALADAQAAATTAGVLSSALNSVPVISAIPQQVYPQEAQPIIPAV